MLDVLLHAPGGPQGLKCDISCMDVRWSSLDSPNAASSVHKLALLLSMQVTLLSTPPRLTTATAKIMCNPNYFADVNHDLS